MGGTKSKCDSSWADTNRDIFETDERKIVAAVVEVAVNVVQPTNVYKFSGSLILELQR